MNIILVVIEGIQIFSQGIYRYFGGLEQVSGFYLIKAALLVILLTLASSKIGYTVAYLVCTVAMICLSSNIHTFGIESYAIFSVFLIEYGSSLFLFLPVVIVGLVLFNVLCINYFDLRTFCKTCVGEGIIGIYALLIYTNSGSLVVWSVNAGIIIGLGVFHLLKKDVLDTITVITGLRLAVALILLIFNTQHQYLSINLLCFNILLFISNLQENLSNRIQKIYLLRIFIDFLLIIPSVFLCLYNDSFDITISYFLALLYSLGFVFENYFYFIIKNRPFLELQSIKAISYLAIVISIQSYKELYTWLVVCVIIEVFFEGLITKKFVKNMGQNFSKFCLNWNSIDFFRIALCIVWLISRFSRSSQIIIDLLILTNFIRGLTGFRCFNGTRYYVRLIFSSIWDIKAFIVIFIYSTIAFGLIIAAPGDSFSQTFINFYDINLGNTLDYDSFNEKYLFYMLATIINVIIMLNLLISILGNSFDKYQNSAKEIDYLEMIDAILEAEGMMLFRRKTNNYNVLNYLKVCDTIVKDSVKPDEELDRKIDLINNSIKSEIQPIYDQFSVLSKKIEDLSKKLDKILEKK